MSGILLPAACCCECSTCECCYGEGWNLHLAGFVNTDDGDFATYLNGDHLLTFTDPTHEDTSGSCDGRKELPDLSVRPGEGFPFTNDYVLFLEYTFVPGDTGFRWWLTFNRSAGGPSPAMWKSQLFTYGSFCENSPAGLSFSLHTASFWADAFGSATVEVFD